MSEPKHKFDEEIEKQLVSVMVDSEYVTGLTNRQQADDEFDTFIDLFDAKRTEKDYDWMSDISIPEFPSHMLTQSAMDVGQYFQSLDFVEAYLMDSAPEALAAADAAKECINRTLNQRHIHHYLKYVRGKNVTNLAGQSIHKCWWEQKLESQKVGERQVEVPLDVDVYGNPMVDDAVQERAVEYEMEDVYEDVPVIDRFNYDVWDLRNVTMDNKYAYTLQDKAFITLRSESTLQDIEADAEEAGYFNIDLLKKRKPDLKSQSREDTEPKDKEEIPAEDSPNRYFDRLERHGKYWVLVDGDEVKPGIDKAGETLDGAEFVETVITFAQNKSGSLLIGFKLQPSVDAHGEPYRPLYRGLCYVHPTDDSGAGDGTYSKELAVGINDTFNLGNDRTLLATMPTMIGNRNALIDNDTIYFEPEHVMEVDDVATDLRELQISDNIQGSVQQIGMLKGQMDQVTAIFPSSMGAMPAEASVKATAIASADQQANTRGNYKSMTYENTALCELYWMILQMTFVHAKPQTAMKLMGDKVYDFNPTLDFFYKPVSQAIETEQSKANKSNKWLQVFNSSVQLAGIHPDGLKMINYAFDQLCRLNGDETAAFADSFLDPNKPVEGQTGTGEQAGQTPASNEQGIPQSGQEQAMRGQVNG